MEVDNQDGRNHRSGTEFKRYARKRIIVGVLLGVVALWVVGTVISFFDRPATVQTGKTKQANQIHSRPVEKDTLVADSKKMEKVPYLDVYPKKTDEKTRSGPVTGQVQEDAAKSFPTHDSLSSKSEVSQPRGVVFVKAVVEPLNYELHERFWGWRPNDYINVTDNVNNFQLGVLEVTRRTAVILTERLSRTGSAAAFDLHLERAMNWFMISANRYWLPSPESKYAEGLNELRKYLKKLEKGSATFYTRTDNLIPLLASYEDLLGSCDENLVKAHEDDGSPVSFFKADDYVYYARGISSAMLTILQAVLVDFHATLESRNGIEILHHAIASCERASEINPWIVMESSLNGLFANHRANMAAPISHARFYLGLLIRTLST